VSVDSSVVANISYNLLAQELTVTYKETGAVYLYRGVTPAQAAGFLLAESKGKYLNAEIRDHAGQRIA
jgi:hypothetical protein